MTLPELSIKNPVFAVMLAAGMVGFGLLGYREMGVSQFPEIDFPVVSIEITNENSSPDTVDGDVTDIVEDSVAGVEGVDYIMSQSIESKSIVTVFFRLSRDIDVAMQEVQNAVAAARRKLPIEIDPPVITKVNPNNLPVMWIALSSRSKPLTEISDFAEKEFKQLIANIPEVGGVQFGGLQSRNIRIWLDSDKLRGFNLSADEVANAIKGQHAELPAGYIKSDRVEFNLRTMGEAYSLDEFRRLLIINRGGQQIYLGDVAVIEDGLQDRRSFARFNRLPAVAVGVRKAIGGNLVAVCENVKRELPRLRKALPAGVEANVPVDYSLFVRENISELRLTLLLGVALTAVVCFLFLGSLGTTLNICLSIPCSLIGTFFVINYGVRLVGIAPFTINLMTLLALSLSVGVVVDDAILVLENIYRHREAGMGRVEAALTGAREISFAAIAATLSIIAIFLPVAFMSGTIGRFFFQFGVTVSVAVFLSLVSALTLTPMLCSLFLDAHKSKPRPMPLAFAALVGLLAATAGSALRLASRLYPALVPFAWWPKTFAAGMVSLPPWVWWLAAAAGEFLAVALLVRYGAVWYGLFDRWLLRPLLLGPIEFVLRLLTRAYAVLLGVALRLAPLVLLVGAALIAVAVLFLAYGVLGVELTPSEDQSRFIVHVVCPVGSSIDHVSDLLEQCEARILPREEVAGILTTVATEPGQLMNEADVFVALTPLHTRKLSQQQIMDAIRRDLEELHDVRVVMRDLSTEGFTPQRGDPVDFALQGEWAKLPQLAQGIMDEMRQSGTVRDVDCDYRPGMPEVQVRPDREKLALVGVPVGRVADSISLMVGGQRVAKYTDRGRRYDVRVRLLAKQRSSPDDLDPLTVRAADNRLVPLPDVTRRAVVSTLPVINRYNHQRTVEITANPARGVSQGEAITRCREIAAKMLPEGFDVVELGNAQAMEQTMRSLVFALVLGIMVAYGILGVQFNSFVHPLTVLMALPFAVTGAFLTLWLTGDTLNMMSMIGLILLMGLVKKNSIILVDYTNQLRAQGLGVREAVVAACPVRLRPILMTSVAAVAGAIPAALGIGPGAETRAPMARAIIGGIVLSTMVTLVLVPVFYVMMERLRAGVRHLVAAPGDGDAAVTE
jgi:multidrug efflux pump subunit AcrB